MRSAILTITIILGIGFSVFGQTAQRPFPHHTKYAAGSIKPAHLKQADLDKATANFYAVWKKQYVKNDCADVSQYYILNDEENVKAKKPVICVSEGQGYGMLIMTLMGGHDKEARTIFDGMYKFVVSHPTSKSQHLMSWSVLKGCVTNHEKNGDDNDNTSATDGDLDIALSLFMADAQWGSKGAINYRKEGISRAKAILDFEINKRNHTILLGDANNAGDEDYFDIRSSDFMPAHLKVFNRYYPNDEWKRVIDESYKVFSTIQAKYSPNAGLIPDFIVFKANQFMPAKPKYLESKFDGDYYYNACRVPLRVGVDYLINGDQRAQNLLNPIAEWIQTKTKDRVDMINAGYFLSGDAIPNHKYTTPAFVCPFAIGSMLNGDNQDWVNDCWDYMGEFEVKDYQYFDNTIQMLSLIILSGNFWLP